MLSAMIPGLKTWTLTLALGAAMPLAAGDAETFPNLTAQASSAAPLLRKINLKAATMIPSSYCAGIPFDRETEVDVPPFDWGVANDDRSAVNQAFAVTLLGGTSSGMSLATQTVQSIPRAGMRIFRNWPRRPTRVTVIHVTDANERFATEYDRTPGCYIPTALVRTVVLDPKPLVIRVDDGDRIAERVETDNDLIR